jgi:hypothetical protein
LLYLGIVELVIFFTVARGFVIHVFKWRWRRQVLYVRLYLPAAVGVLFDSLYSSAYATT